MTNLPYKKDLSNKGRPKMKGYWNDKGLTIPDAKECVKDRREWERIVGGDVDSI